MFEKNYSIGNIFRLVLDLIYTKLFWNNSRLVRYPIYIRGKRYIVRGANFTSGRFCRIEVIKIKNRKPPILKIGQNVQINDNVHICAIEKIEIGSDVLIASHVYISDNSHGCYSGSSLDSSPHIPPIERVYPTRPIYIGKNVWIGEGAIILPGVKIGDGSIIGAHSVVNRDVPKMSVAVGAPARIIKRYNEKTKHWENIILNSLS